MKIVSKDRLTLYFALLLGIFNFYALIISCIFLACNIFLELYIDIENKKINVKNFKKKEIAFEVIKSIKLVDNSIKMFDENNNLLLSFPKSILDSNGISYENFYAFFFDENLKYDLNLFKKDDYIIKHKNRNSNIYILICLCLYLHIPVLFLILFITEPIAFPIINRNIYLVLYSLIGVLIIIIYFLLKKFIKAENYFIKNCISVILIIILPIVSIVSLLGLPASFYISKTNEITNYENVLEEANNLYFFPKEITKEMNVIDFYYYESNSWDIITEVYLEVKLDSVSFENEYSKYNDLVVSKFNSNLEENIFEEEISLDKDYFKVSIGTIEKIIFDKENKKIIYYYLHALDPYDYDEWYYKNKFNIDVDLLYKD